MNSVLGRESQILLAAIAASLGGSACTESDVSAKTQPTPQLEAGTDAGPVDPGDAFFAPVHVVEVQVELAPSDWQALRLEGRDLLDAFEGKAWSFEYTGFTGAVTVDGTRYENVEVRKKGFNGSISMYRPSIKVDLAKSVSDQNHAGFKKLTLNNNRQDPSNTHQCLAYGLLAKAGVPVPRCNLAHVVVNGEDLGTYTNVEMVTKTMVGRFFADDTGNLYEAEAADFARDNVERLELKTNKKLNDRSDLEPVITALKGSDDQLLSALSRSIDLEKFRTYWAMEVLIGHWDSYSGNYNNYWLYHDPTSGKFQFIPWGTDTAFEGPIYGNLNPSITVFAKGRLTNRLYNLPEQRELYRKRLGELNDTLWDETAMLAEVDQVAKLAPNTAPDALERQRNVIKTHAGQLRAALAEPAPEWIDEDALPKSVCYGMRSDVRGEFQTTWRDLATKAPGVGTFTMSITLDGKPQEVTWSGMAGTDAATGSDALIRATAILADGRLLFLQFTMPPATVKPGVQPFYGFESWGLVNVIEGQSSRWLGAISDGAITLAQAATQTDAPVVGSISGRLLQFRCLDEPAPAPAPAPTK